MFAWLSVAAGVLWSLRLLGVSPGVITQDSIGHFIISREAWHRPALMLHHWGRPLDTVLYMPAALFGLVYARLTSILIAAVTVLLTWRLARRLDVGYAFAVPLLLWFQPWFPQLSVHASLTELPFALMMVLSAWLFVSGQFLLASVIIGLFPLIRVEAIALTGLWLAVCALRKDWRAAVVVVLPVTAYLVLYHGVFGRLPAGDYPVVPNVSTLFGPHPGSAPHRSLFTMPRLLVNGVGYSVAALSVLSVPLLMRGTTRQAVFAWYAVYLMIHLALYPLGVSTPDQRYLLPLAPAVALAAALGLGGLVNAARSVIRRPLKRAAPALGHATAAICAVAVLVVGLNTPGVPLDSEAIAAQSAASWLRQKGLADEPIAATHVYVHYFLPGHLNAFRPGADPENLFTFEPPPLSEMPAGTIALWDSHYSDKYGLKRSALAADPQWSMMKQFDAYVKGADTSDDAHIVIFRKR